LGINIKKTTLYRERNEEKRREYISIIARIPKESIVYVDESGIDEYLYRDHCYARRGVKVVGEISGKKFKRTNTIAGYVNRQTIAECVYESNCDRDFIEDWVEKFLLKNLKKGQVVIWDNASFHKSSKVKEMLESIGCRLIFLPPYSPDLNPIEHFGANLKKWLKNHIATYDTLWDAIVAFFSLDSYCTNSNAV
jgi:transposase